MKDLCLHLGASLSSGRVEGHEIVCGYLACRVTGLCAQDPCFVPICRNFDKDSPLQSTLVFNHLVFAEDKAIVETQYPEDLPINLQEEVHIRADKSSITYRQGLAEVSPPEKVNVK